MSVPGPIRPPTGCRSAACTLPTREQPMLVAAFDDLCAASLRAVERPDVVGTRARLVLAGDAALAGRVRRLADAETSCCSFFTFMLTALDTDQADETVVALDIEVPAARSDVLTALVERAGWARQEAS